MVGTALASRSAGVVEQPPSAATSATTPRMRIELIPHPRGLSRNQSERARPGVRRSSKIDEPEGLARLRRGSQLHLPQRKLKNIAPYPTKLGIAIKGTVS